jgi:multicomponent Na+:H+ antiporter subunit G
MSTPPTAFVGDALVLVGAAFLFLGSLGLRRMPDVFNRIQVGTKAATLGILAVLAGIGCHHPDWWAKLALIALFLLVTSPVGSSTIARAALLAGMKPCREPGTGSTAGKERTE